MKLEVPGQMHGGPNWLLCQTPRVAAGLPGTALKAVGAAGHPFIFKSVLLVGSFVHDYKSGSGSSVSDVTSLVNFPISMGRLRVLYYM